MMMTPVNTSVDTSDTPNSSECMSEYVSEYTNEHDSANNIGPYSSPNRIGIDERASVPVHVCDVVCSKICSNTLDY